MRAYIIVQGAGDYDQDSECDLGKCGDQNTCIQGRVGLPCKSHEVCGEDRNLDGVCDEYDCGHDHFVVLAGYDDSGGYWIVKNSWGDTWAEEGYYKLGYGACNIGVHAHYVEPADIDFAPVADAGGPYEAECTGVDTTLRLDGTGSFDPENDPILYHWTSDCQGATFDDTYSSTPLLTIPSAGCNMECEVGLMVYDDGPSWRNGYEATTVRVSDTQGPVIQTPADIHLACRESTNPRNTDRAQAMDACGGQTRIHYSDTRVDGLCGNTYRIDRMWVAQDECGNTTRALQQIWVEDKEPPDLTLPRNTTVACDESTDPRNTGMARATDKCAGRPLLVYADTLVAGSCYNMYRIERTWTATDDCGNSTSGGPDHPGSRREHADHRMQCGSHHRPRRSAGPTPLLQGDGH